MRKIVVIAVREYVAAVRTKAFLVTVVLMPVIMCGSILAHALIGDRVDVTDHRFAVLDRTGQIAPVLLKAARQRNERVVHDSETGEKVKPAYLLETVEPRDDDAQAQRLELSEMVRGKELHAFIEIGPAVISQPDDLPADDPGRTCGYYGENAALDEARRWASGVISENVMSIRATAAEVDRAVLARVTAPVHLGALGLVSVDRDTGEISVATRSSRETAILVPLIIMMMMFAVVIMAAQPLMQSVLEEKMQRIAEVLLGSVSPFQLMMGKLFGTVGVSFTVVGIYVIGGLVAADRTGAKEFVPYEIIPWVFAFQVGAVFMYGAMFSAIGAACNDLKEAQSLMTPVMVMLMMPMFVMFNIIREPLSGFATGLSLFPLFTPLLMLMRQSSPTAIPAWQPWVGLLGVAVSTVVCVWAAGRIFRIGLLMQGKPPRIQDLVRWAVRG